MELWIWAVILLALGTGLAVMEVFFPSAGILGFLSATAVLASIVVGFYHSSVVGMAFLIAAMVVLPTAIVLGFKYWPKTAMGRRVLLGVPAASDVLPDDPEKEHLKQFIGKRGTAKSKLLLSGVITIDGQTLDATSESWPVEVGQAVRVIGLQGRTLIVRPEDAEPEPPPTDPLQQVYDDPFDLPPA